MLTRTLHSARRRGPCVSTASTDDLWNEEGFWYSGTRHAVRIVGVGGFKGLLNRVQLRGGRTGCVRTFVQRLMDKRLTSSRRWLSLLVCLEVFMPLSNIFADINCVLSRTLRRISVPVPVLDLKFPIGPVSGYRHLTVAWAFGD